MARKSTPASFHTIQITGEVKLPKRLAAFAAVNAIYTFFYYRKPSKLDLKKLSPVWERLADMEEKVIDVFLSKAPPELIRALLPVEINVSPNWDSDVVFASLSDLKQGQMESGFPWVDAKLVYSVLLRPENVSWAFAFLEQERLYEERQKEEILLEKEKNRGRDIGLALDLLRSAGYVLRKIPVDEKAPTATKTKAVKK